MKNSNSTRQPKASNSTALFIPLKRVYFEQFEEGVKRFEFRPYGPRWNEKTCRIGRPVTLSLGYGKQRRLYGWVSGFDVSERWTQSAAWKDCYGEGAHKLAARIEIEILG